MNFDVYFHHVFVLFKDKAGILMKQNKNGFTLMEMLIVIAIIAVLIAVAIPVFASQLEKAREATDLANARSAYAQVSTEALLGDSEATVTVDLKQKQADWQSVDPVNIGGIVHSKSQGNTKNWIGVAAPNGTCVVSYKEDYGIILNWSGKNDPSTPKYPFNTTVTDFFPLLYDTDFWKNDSSIKTNANFEFDSRCPDSQYVPSIIAEIDKLNNSLLQQPDCTWAYLGDGRKGKEANRYLFWTSLNTDNIGPGKEIPVIIQTGDKRYYVSKTTTGTRKGKNYVTISESLTRSQYQQTLKNGKEFSSLEAAYDAYLKALGDSEYNSVRQS